MLICSRHQRIVCKLDWFNKRNLLCLLTVLIPQTMIMYLSIPSLTSCTFELHLLVDCFEIYQFLFTKGSLVCMVHRQFKL